MLFYWGLHAYWELSRNAGCLSHCSTDMSHWRSLKLRETEKKHLLLTEQQWIGKAVKKRTAYLKFKIMVFTKKLEKSKYRLHDDDLWWQHLVLVLHLVTEDFVSGWHEHCLLIIARLHVYYTPQVGKCFLCCNASIFYLLTKFWCEASRLDQYWKQHFLS